MLKGILYSCLFWVFGQIAWAQQSLKIEFIDSLQIRNLQGFPLSKISYRGLSVVDDQVIWASGSKGAVIKSTDGGRSFDLIRIPGYDSVQFRDIEAFGADIAVVMSSGSPGYILKTFDGGVTWRKVFEDKRNDFFLDAMDFWNANEGMAIGDPIDERFVLYRTIDGGNTWHPIDTAMRPYAIPGESLFAASGSCFRCMPKQSIAFVSGGSKAVFHWLQIDKKYQRFELKSMPQGKNSAGAFSFDFNDNVIVVVGGDYVSDTSKVKQAIYSYNYDKDGLQLLNMKPFYSNFRSCVELTENGTLYTCGTKGIDKNHIDQTVTSSGALTKLSDQSFNTVMKAKKGKLVVLVGDKGRIALIR